MKCIKNESSYYNEYVANCEDKKRRTKEANMSISKFCEFTNTLPENNKLEELMLECCSENERSGFIAGFRYATKLCLSLLNIANK